MEAFDLLNKKLQRIIHEMKWESFRPIQNEAILHLINSPSDVILSAHYQVARRCKPVKKDETYQRPCRDFADNA